MLGVFLEDLAAAPASAVGYAEQLGLNDPAAIFAYAFTLPEIIARGQLRPLRDPKTAGIDDL